MSVPPVVVQQGAASKGEKRRDLTPSLSAYARIKHMKAVFLYRPNSEFSRIVEDYARDFEGSRGKPIKLLSLDTVEGADLARLYDIVQYPALVVITDDGQLLRAWQGEHLPLMDEVSGFLDH
jgi:hypothetical protein